MGKHDRKSFRGKLLRGTYGKRRPHKNKKKTVSTKQAQG
ncbi:MAG TPA: 30S ribosomal protein THX [Gemmatimonadales bacterium]